MGCISDNGRGFEVGANGSDENMRLGLLGMRERVESLGGSFSIHSAPGAGTEIRLQLPLRPASVGNTERNAGRAALKQCGAARLKL